MKIYFKNEKKIVVIEMSVPWIENRESKLTEKIDKYKRSQFRSANYSNPLFSFHKQNKISSKFQFFIRV